MSNCVIEVHLGKDVKTFTSDAELDQYLAGRTAELGRLYKITDVKNFDKVFSLTEAQGASVSKINDIIKAHNNATKTVEKTKK